MNGILEHWQESRLWAGESSTGISVDKLERSIDPLIVTVTQSWSFPKWFFFSRDYDENPGAHPLSFTIFCSNSLCHLVFTLHVFQKSSFECISPGNCQKKTNRFKEKNFYFWTKNSFKLKEENGRQMENWWKGLPKNKRKKKIWNFIRKKRKGGKEESQDGKSEGVKK